MMQAESDQPPPEGDKELSLEDLSDAFARMLRPEGEPGGTAAQQQGSPQEAEEGPAVDQADRMPEITPQRVLEAMLFVGHPENEPLTRQQAAAVIHGVEADEIDALTDQLNADYAAAGHVVEIVSEGAGYRMILSPQLERVRRRFYGRVRQARLSQAAIEVLALIAYSQPMTSKDVSQMRGHPSSAVLSQLVRRQLLRIERPPEKPRAPVYYTTQRFLDLFGLDRLEDLPRSQDAGP
ncbi:MAG: SMC-Scp complex subunit ScpB [Planctomycetales bacterium]|nr:SMC-Scp complex subunit ScpB [Planctomycetales bacterium]NIM10048.1 SMC-Scp complex subunit ScpB [Planctomycetales bacterium]NIN09489.1 SMC-Scp complex subunit ScpB [Planctomycetales bacterium]NIN77152.1 SMC-Scp complex subunit ScpB [Planctomycetales bacterium]NIO34336.1 SMC-Scp complex subunit ScpB [Planctomycetales bacterium]